MKIFIDVRCFLAVCLLALASDSEGVMLSSAYENEQHGDPDFEIALSAVQHQDWDRAISALMKVIERRAFDDDAHTLLGYAYRKQGNYYASLKSYRRALELNPHHRGALEYLGEAYLELGERQLAIEKLERLAEICRRQKLPHSGEGWKQRCPEWRELDFAIRAQESREWTR